MSAVGLRHAAALPTLRSKETPEEALDSLSLRRAELVELVEGSPAFESVEIPSKRRDDLPESEHADDEEGDSDFLATEDGASSDEDDGEAQEEARRELKWLLRDQQDQDATAWLAGDRTTRRKTPLSQSKSFQLQFWEDSTPIASHSTHRSSSFVSRSSNAKKSVERRKRAKVESSSAGRRHKSRSQAWEWDAALSWAVVALFLAVALASQAHAASKAHDELCLGS